jgi:hypothetical protein
MPGQSTKIERVCGHCGRTFLARASAIAGGGGLFCSRACVSLSQRSMVERACEHCRAVFLVKPAKVKLGEGRFCSKRCHYASPISIETRFLRHVGLPEENGCILWTGALTRAGGYGTLGEGGTSRRMIGAHRYAWERVNGAVPDGLFVLHRCDNPRCVNVAHLWLGTAADNSADMVAKGRNPRGEKVVGAKLTDDAVRRIRSCPGKSTFALARQFHVAEATIYAVRKGLTWRHVTD